jgi:uncharacterized protein (DUF362 family)
MSDETMTRGTPMQPPFTRRRFLGTAAGAAIGFSGVLALGANSPPAAMAARLREQGRGRVVGIEHPGSLESVRKEVPAVVEAMTHEAVKALTGKTTVAQAWRELVVPTDIVGIKLNCLAAPGMSTSPAMVAAIVLGLRSVGIPNERIILYEQYKDRLLDRSGFTLNDDPKKGPLVMHLGGREPLTDEGMLGYEATAAKHGAGESCYSNLLKHCTAIINAPVIKDHNLSGVTVGMKNMTHGNIHNPHHFHEHDCNPQIAEIYAHPKILDKVRVVVCDGLRVQYDGGPQDSPRARVAHHRIYAATDPVAIDSWGLVVVNELREKHGKSPLSERHPAGNYLVRAAELGIGVADPKTIDMQLTVMPA